MNGSIGRLKWVLEGAVSSQCHLPPIVGNKIVKSTTQKNIKQTYWRTQNRQLIIHILPKLILPITAHRRKVRSKLAYLSLFYYPLQFHIICDVNGISLPMMICRYILITCIDMV
jgi:hypothetical protein